jgi:hypothetical protein
MTGAAFGMRLTALANFLIILQELHGICSLM